jgi:uncharacterized protein YndB with AHSA1/START domain
MTDAIVLDDRVLRLERLIAAPPESVFALWTEPEKLVQWWGPEGCDVPASALDVRPGGHWKTTMRTPEGKLHTVSGVYRVIEPPRRLVFTWGWDDDRGVRGHETEVTVTFDAAPGGTRLVLQQQTFASAEQRDKHGQGWSSSLVCLERFAKQQGG